MSNLGLDHVFEFMEELRAYQGRIVVVKIGGNSIAEDKLFLSKIAAQVVFLNTNGVHLVLVHGGGPQIDSALRDKKIKVIKGKDGRRITSPQAMTIVAQVMKDMNLEVVKALIEAGCDKKNVFSAVSYQKPLMKAKSLDPKNVKSNRSGKPVKMVTAPILKALRERKIVVLHSLASGTDGETLYNTNGDDYAMCAATNLKAKRLILVTNVGGVLDQNKKRIAVIDKAAAKQLIKEGVVSGGMVPKVESALAILKQGVGGVAIIDGSRPWSLLAELLTHQGLGTLFRQPAA